MKIKEIEIIVEKICYVIADVVEVPEGVSRKTGKPYPAFANLKVLVHGQSEISTFQVDMQYVDEVRSALEELDYLTPVKVSGVQNAAGSFKVTAVEKWEVQ